MRKGKQKASQKTKKAIASRGKHPRTPEELRLALREHDIHTSADSQLQALGAIYRVGTHENTVNLRTLLSAIGRVQNLISLSMRASQMQAKKNGFKSEFFLTA